MTNTIRIDYDDHGYDIIAKVNAALESHGLEFICDELEHDGFDIFELKKVEIEK